MQKKVEKPFLHLTYYISPRRASAISLLQNRECVVYYILYLCVQFHSHERGAFE